MTKKLETTNERRPIVQSALDTDHYKFTMGQFVFHRYVEVPVKYAFANRTKNVKLAELISEKDLRRELDHVRNLKPTEAEMNYLAGLRNNGKPLFQQDYLDFRRNLTLPDYELKFEKGDIKLEFAGKWAEAIYWETPALAVVNELHYRALTKNFGAEEAQAVFREGQRRLEEKLELLEENPLTTFLEFGTRRRFSAEWQDYVVEKLTQRVPKQIVGTSNVHLAMKYGLAPKGTQAHETFMVMSGIMHGSDDEIRASHNKVVEEWLDEYGRDLSVILTDTYGTEFFFRDMTEKQARECVGLRQDSGNPTEFANRQMQFYEKLGINPQEKLFVPSDGLTAREVVELANKFRGKIKQTAGWGTNLTNDLGFGTLSLVVKAVEANGYGTVKLSDNPAKAMGKPEDVQRFMKIFEYNPGIYARKECLC